MPTIKRNLTVETDEGKSVTVKVDVSGYFDSGSSTDSLDEGVPMWYIDDTDYEIPDNDDDGEALSELEKDEVSELIEEKINEETWDFSKAPPDDESYDEFEDEDSDENDEDDYD